MTVCHDLAVAIAAFDGRSTTILTEAAIRYRDDPGYLDALVSLSVHPDRPVSEGATWMFRAVLKDGIRPTREQVARLIESVSAIEAWQAQLHFCQCVAMLDIPEACRPALVAWLRDRLDAHRPFLRAWALDALCNLEGPTDEVRALLARMASDEAASVRARVRALRRLAVS